MPDLPPESEDKKRPIPVREGLERQGQGERPAPARPGPTPVRSLEPLPSRALPDADDPAGPASASVEAIEAPLPQPDRDAAGATSPARDPESLPVLFLLGEQEWVARVEGYGRSGTSRDPGAPLMALTFARGAEPDRPLFETLCPGRALEDLTEGQLAELLAGARPVPDSSERSEIFPDTRVRKKEL